MKRYTIIWDFDGTILPSDPYDSEQSLLLHKIDRSEEKVSLYKRLLARAVICADMKEWLGGSFKKYYLYLLKGTRVEMLDPVAQSLAKKITPKDRQTFFRLNQAGHRMMIISCGTADLIERVLQNCGIYDCFQGIAANRFQFINGCISGMDISILSPQDKLKVVVKDAKVPEQTIVIGDGYTDLPLLDWSGFPVLIDRTGQKRAKYRQKTFHFIASVSELEDVGKFFDTLSSRPQAL